MDFTPASQIPPKWGPAGGINCLYFRLLSPITLLIWYFMDFTPAFQIPPK